MQGNLQKDSTARTYMCRCTYLLFLYTKKTLVVAREKRIIFFFSRQHDEMHKTLSDA